MTRARKHTWLHKSLWLSAKVVSDLSVLLGLKTASCFQEETSGNFISTSSFCRRVERWTSKTTGIATKCSWHFIYFYQPPGSIFTGHPDQFLLATQVNFSN